MELNEIIDRRSRILKVLEELQIDRFNLTEKIKKDENDILKGVLVDTSALHRKRYSLEKIKNKIRLAQGELTNLKAIEKKANVESNESMQMRFYRQVFLILQNRFGKDYVKQLFSEASALAP